MTSSAIAVTFAFSAHKLLGWVTYPLLGRLSDRSSSSLGRRTLYMGGGLVVAGGATFLYPVVPGYWPLVGAIAAARLGFLSYRLAGYAVLPETFGRSRWAKAAAVTGIAAFVMPMLVRAVVVVAGSDDDPSSWAPAFRLSGALTVIAGLVVLALVRQPAGDGEARRGRPPSPAWGARLRELLEGPNGRILVAGLMLDAAAGGATARLLPIFNQRAFGAGARTQAIGALAVPWIGMMTAMAGPWLARRFSRRQLALALPAVAATAAAGHLVVDHYWQSLALGLMVAPFAMAALFALSPLHLRLLPHAPGMAEGSGFLLGPLAAIGVAAGFASAVAVDISGSYRVIWLFPAALQLAKVVLMTRLWLPPGQERTDLRALGGAITRARRQLGRPLLSGELPPTDTDSTDLLGQARGLLGDPYDFVVRPPVPPLRTLVVPAGAPTVLAADLAEMGALMAARQVRFCARSPVAHHHFDTTTDERGHATVTVDLPANAYAVEARLLGGHLRSAEDLVVVRPQTGVVVAGHLVLDSGRASLAMCTSADGSVSGGAHFVTADGHRLRRAPVRRLVIEPDRVTCSGRGHWDGRRQRFEITFLADPPEVRVAVRDWLGRPVYDVAARAGADDLVLDYDDEATLARALERQPSNAPGGRAGRRRGGGR